MNVFLDLTTARKKEREGKVLRVLLSGRCLPRNERPIERKAQEESCCGIENEREKDSRNSKGNPSLFR